MNLFQLRAFDAVAREALRNDVKNAFETPSDRNP